MPKPSFTPGPWEVVNGTDVYPVGDTFARHFVADCDPDDAPIFNDGNHADTDADYAQAKANARLIAAAPEMLEALKLIAESLLFSCYDDRAWDTVDDAIAKAEGRDNG